MPGKALAIMLIVHLIGVTIMALTLNGLEKRMIADWSAGRDQAHPGVADEARPTPVP